MISKFKNTFLIILLCLINAHCLASNKVPDTIYAFVTKVVDGDTIYIKHNKYGNIKVRLAEIDTPEKGQPFGKEATRALSKIISKKIVRLDKVTIDRYKRIVGKISYNKIDINHYLVRNGYAWSYDKYNRRKEIIDAENLARKEKIGLWSQIDTPPIPPWKWREMFRQNE